MKAKEFVFGCALVVVAAVSCYALFESRRAARKIAFVDIGKLLEQYKLKIDLDKEAVSKLMALKSALDSSRMAALAAPAISGRDSVVRGMEKSLEQYYLASNNQINNAVWQRLNPLLARYGALHNFTLIIGATGTGTVLYGDPDVDITPEIVKYANENYETGR